MLAAAVERGAKVVVGAYGELTADVVDGDGIE